MQRSRCSGRIPLLIRNVSEAPSPAGLIMIPYTTAGELGGISHPATWIAGRLGDAVHRSGETGAGKGHDGRRRHLERTICPPAAMPHPRPTAPSHDLPRASRLPPRARPRSCAEQQMLSRKPRPPSLITLVETAPEPADPAHCEPNGSRTHTRGCIESHSASVTCRGSRGAVESLG